MFSTEYPISPQAAFAFNVQTGEFLTGRYYQNTKNQMNNHIETTKKLSEIRKNSITNGE